MITVTRSLRIAVAMQVIALASPASHGEPIQPSPPAFDVATALESASTKSDHEKIAEYFEREAKDLDSKSALHQAMKKTYQGGGHLRGFNARMRVHCEKLINLYKAAAIENRAMAKSHLAMTDKKSQ